MMILRRILCGWLVFSFLGVSLTLPPAHAQSDGLSFLLPKPGTRVNLSPVFDPVLIKGLKVHPENPFLFDFIVDPGNENLSDDAFKQTSQRLVNYFLASLATPPKDLWVNLSPLEKNHIIPDTLIKTELGRDLLAEDYMLKQVSASLIYPESSFGKSFWARVYDQAYKKFGVTQVPVNIFNKVWILPQKAKVFERGNTVYIVNAHLKVMLEEDYLAQSRMGKSFNKEAVSSPVKELSKQVLREIVVPLIEKEVNEGKNFSQLRQVFYSLILAQWYQDAFKRSILNKDYSGRNKVAGIDVSDPNNKELIYQQYLSAYKKGVFNYIKEETDQISQQPVPRKYFSGGFVDQKIEREPASGSDVNFAMVSAAKNERLVSVKVDPAMIAESVSSWYDLKRPWGIYKELKGYLKDGKKGVLKFINKYTVDIDEQKLYPVQSAWPILKAIRLLSKSEEASLVHILQEIYPNGERPELVDKILLMNKVVDAEQWMKNRTPHLIGRAIYLTAAEIHFWTGGLGPVMKFLGKGMKALGADVSYIEPWYEYDTKGNLLDYTDEKNIGIKDLKDFDEFSINIGDRQVKVKTVTGIDENGVRVYMFRDIQDDGSTYYTKMLYNYQRSSNEQKFNNPVSYEDSVAFINVASAELIKRLETKRKKEQGDAWEPAVVHSNDGQLAPLQAVTESRYGEDPVVKDILWSYTTHTYLNRGGNQNVHWAINVFLKYMMRIKGYYINAFRHLNRAGQTDYVGYTDGGEGLADVVGTVSNSHGDDINREQTKFLLAGKRIALTNGAAPEEMAAIYREEFNKLKNIDVQPFTPESDFERPTALELARVKIELKKRLNAANIRTANGDFVHVDENSLLIGFARRLVDEKAGRKRALTNDNIWKMVKEGANVVLLGNHQGYYSEDLAAGLKELERKINAAKSEYPAEFPGKFQFVETFTSSEKKIFLAALDLQVQDSDANEANGATEEPAPGMGAYNATANLKEGRGIGAMGEQGLSITASPHDVNGELIWDILNPGEGNILLPTENTSESWMRTVYGPLIRLWNKDKDHSNFYKGAAIGPRLDVVAHFLLTSATNMRAYENALARQERQAEDDSSTELNMILALRAGNQNAVKGILYNGSDRVNPFGFEIVGQEGELAENGGLIAFVNKKKDLEERYGYDALLRYYLDSHFQRYLKELFRNTGMAASLLDNWINKLGDDPNSSSIEQLIRMGQFVQNLTIKLKRVSDSAMIYNPGGIKLDNINVERQGHLTADIVTDKSLEDMLLNAQGLHGVIVGIIPIPNLIDAIH